MFDDFREKFESDDEYDDYKNSYDDYKNKTGMFDAEQSIKEIIEFQNLLYQAFMIEKKKFVRIPEKYTKTANVPMYMFYCETIPDTDTITLIMN